MIIARKFLIHVVILLSSTSIFTQPSYAIDGTGAGVAKEILSIKSCGKQSYASNFDDLILNSNGTWSVTTLTGSYTGTWTDANPSKPDRKFNLAFDSGSYAQFTSFLENQAEILCEIAPITMTSVSISNFIATTNKQQSKITTKLKVTATGTSPIATSTGKYTLSIKASFAPTGNSGGGGGTGGGSCQSGVYGCITIQGSGLPSQYAPVTGTGASAGAADGFLQTLWQDSAVIALSVSIADNYQGINGKDVSLQIPIGPLYRCQSGTLGTTGDCNGASYDRVSRVVTFSNVKLIGPGGSTAILNGSLNY